MGSSGGGENLRVVLREILARITMVKERVEMFTKLQQEPVVVATIGPFCTTTSNSVSSTTTTTMLHDQEVVCSLNDPPMTMVLRCTGNCPLMDDSIYIDQLHGIGSGWGDIPSRIHEKLLPQSQRSSSTENDGGGAATATLDATKNMKQYRFRTPLDIIHAVREEVQLCMHQQQFVLPDTPRLPIRHPGTQWLSEQPQQDELIASNSNSSNTRQ